MNMNSVYIYIYIILTYHFLMQGTTFSDVCTKLACFDSAANDLSFSFKRGAFEHTTCGDGMVSDNIL